MLDLDISSSDRHSSVVIIDGLLLCQMASIWRLMIKTSCIISFHKAKILSSNFRISIPVPDVKAMFVSGWDWPDLLLSVVKVLLLTFIFSCFSSPLCSNPLWYHLKTCSAHAEACGDRCGPYVRILSVMQGRSHTHTHTHTHTGSQV